MSSFFCDLKIKFNMNKICLSDAIKNKMYKILMIDCDEKLKNRLSELGVEEGKFVEIKHFNFGRKSLMIKVSGVRLVIEKKLCEKIIIENE